MCSMNQIESKHLDEAFPKLVSLDEKQDLKKHPTEEDVRTGLELFHAIMFCPIMDIKLFLFVDQLLSNESSRTIIQTYVNLFRSGIIKAATSISLMKEFYDVLATTLNLQYGNILLATSKKSQLQAVLDNNWPFFTNHTDLVKTCLLDLDCEGIQGVVQNIGMNFSVANYRCFYKPSLFQIAAESHESCPSTQST